MASIILKIILITYYFVMASIAVFAYVDSKNKDSCDKWDFVVLIIALIFIVFAIGVTCAIDFRWHDIGEVFLR